MNTRFLLSAVFAAGVGSGWLGKTWFGTPQTESTDQPFISHQQVTPTANHNDRDLTPALDATITRSNETSSVNVDFSDPFAPRAQTQPSTLTVTDSRTHVQFTRLLQDRRYADAVALYQETTRHNETAATQLKRELLNHLSTLSSNGNSRDFSELIDNYLSIYYDDIDILLLLAEFNQANSSFLETADVYLLAKNYAYNISDQQNLLTHFNGFVKNADQIYTSQQDWLSLINLYSHIEALGLMTPSHQYGQALAHLGNGDRYSAMELLEQISTDSLIGKQATIALRELSANSEATAISSNAISAEADTIALQQRGNQYLVNLTVNRQDNVNLLIDTGASMTTLSQASFYALSTNGDAIEQDRRVFHTANGVAQGTVYTVPEINLGPYLLKDTQIAVLDFDTVQGIDGLLGMNVLGQFRFQIDQENRSLLLNRKQ